MVVIKPNDLNHCLKFSSKIDIFIAPLDSISYTQLRKKKTLEKGQISHAVLTFYRK